jgi:hypothetical protein
MGPLPSRSASGDAAATSSRAARNASPRSSRLLCPPSGSEARSTRGMRGSGRSASGPRRTPGRAAARPPRRRWTAMGSRRSGGGGIRTLGRPCGRQRFSRSRFGFELPTLPRASASAVRHHTLARNDVREPGRPASRVSVSHGCEIQPRAGEDCRCSSPARVASTPGRAAPSVKKEPHLTTLRSVLQLAGGPARQTGQVGSRGGRHGIRLTLPGMVRAGGAPHVPVEGATAQTLCSPAS